MHVSVPWLLAPRCRRMDFSTEHDDVDLDTMDRLTYGQRSLATNRHAALSTHVQESSAFRRYQKSEMDRLDMMD